MKMSIKKTITTLLVAGVVALTSYLGLKTIENFQKPKIKIVVEEQQKEISGSSQTEAEEEYEYQAEDQTETEEWYQTGKRGLEQKIEIKGNMDTILIDLDNERPFDVSLEKKPPYEIYGKTHVMYKIYTRVGNNWVFQCSFGPFVSTLDSVIERNDSIFAFGFSGDRIHQLYIGKDNSDYILAEKQIFVPCEEEQITKKEQPITTAEESEGLEGKIKAEDELFDSNWEEWEKRGWHLFPSKNLALKIGPCYQQIFPDTIVLGEYMQTLDNYVLVVPVEARAMEGTTTFDFLALELSNGKTRERLSNEQSKKAYKILNPEKAEKIDRILRDGTTFSDEVTVGSSRYATQRRKIPFYIAYETSAGTILDPPADYINFIPRINGPIYLVCGKDSVQIISLDLQPKWGYIKKRKPREEGGEREIRNPLEESKKTIKKFGRTYYFVKELQPKDSLYDEEPGIEYKAKVTTEDGIEKIVKELAFFCRKLIFDYEQAWTGGARNFRTKSCMAKIEGVEYHIPFKNIKSIEFFRTRNTLDSAIIYLVNNNKKKQQQ